MTVFLKIFTDPFVYLLKELNPDFRTWKSNFFDSMKYQSFMGLAKSRLYFTGVL